MAEMHTVAPDQAQRDAALNTSISCIVQAPAGSGKTELLTQRFLKLLSEVDEPEQILAITFTRAATAEMRLRILKQLETARSKPHGKSNAMLTSARAALAHAEARGWNLLEQPQRLNIQTIDSLCMRIAHEQPLLARMGGHLQPQEDARPLYDEAARRTLANLGNQNREIHFALMHLLELRDNNLPDAERLIAAMLAQRDQWLPVLPLSGELTSEDWDAVRLGLEAPFRNATRWALKAVHQRLTAEQELSKELIELANYASGNSNELGLGAIAHIHSLPEPTEKFLDQWLCFCSLLLTKSSDAWRKQVTAKDGFPPSANRRKDSPEQQYKDRMIWLIGRLSKINGLLEALCSIRKLPPTRYNEDQWSILRGMFIVLRYSVAELRVLFAEQNVIDFVELGIAALQVLGAEHPGETVLGISESVQHLLVDEFQDTSRRQLKLLEMLLRAWSADERRTVFLVGDPMQSIYMFRQAEVELFEQVRQHGIVSDGQVHRCEALQLSANFRSHAGLTEPLNSYFDIIFRGNNTPGAAAVSFSPSEAVTAALPVKSVVLHRQFMPKGDQEASDWARKREAEDVIQLIEKHIPRIERAAGNPEDSFTVAVLARARQHLTLIARMLREHNIPYRSVELETLAERQEVRDLLSLTRALLHPMDRVAWLSVLRAPWCGLTLEDMHVLCGEDDKCFARVPVVQLIKERQSLLSSDGQQRLKHVFTILDQALEVRYQQGQSFSTWVERTWHALGGPLCLDDMQQENVHVFFSMLDSMSPDGVACLGDELDQQLERLFAQPDPRASERFGVQLMTIHKAKGLGFDVVIVPGLERSTGRDPKPLISMLQRACIDNADEDELLVAPIDSKGSDTHPLYRWVQKQRLMRETEERKRIFYVACTRARRELHLFGTATVTNSDDLQAGAPDSLLSSAWPALEPEFVSAYLELNRQKVISFPEPQPGIVDIAAAAIPLHPPLLLRRLPLSAERRSTGINVAVTSTFSATANDLELFERPEGPRLHRLTGTMIHTLLERLSRRPAASGTELRAWLESQASAMLRVAALPHEQALRARTEMIAAIEAAAADPHGQWLLARHPEAQSEASWTGWIDGTLRTLRADRVFHAGSEPLSTGTDYVWVVDYKTTRFSGTNIAGFLAAQRKQYEPQLALYGTALRKIHGEKLPLRFALYFPLLRRLEYWSG
ncbi:MAG TPA: UvrD-helicase domain-containing protein [Pseudacidobacterium sp.]|jgi:ATP-dependent exoDNAse (exonuclease V) beta subunit|nr:UvrD-helicase domain-containing protein [Pseudacidobacterium sp.]